MDKIKILAIGRDPSIMEVVIRLINNHDRWNGTGVCRDEEAVERFRDHAFDLVLLTNGITGEEENNLRNIFSKLNPDILIIQHYGGGSGLLYSEIREALDRKNNQAFL